ncbi:Putative metallo-beta-lactamase, ribonuclease Z/Hydroxyacylglutathione hydrolase [Colletotrichum destructivum]|uniref:Metallo-beta-lactamase, ribonuclease Z/Hydroxyacylglutathione hydrolase n=1 Tax=Colletotrichum destructivum TaxID=34406 RepID=A0AAX4I300_9PEZI|nr:Putative metallo-beta-lactamase, ribonuclease Z/Hydroxyacylglutathione hydrolase [Colletotrichum destructivum]
MASDRISLEFITTGNVWMRNPMQGQPIANRSIAMRFLRSLTGDWIGPMPLGAFLIHHPAGPILFDTGVSTHCTEPGYFPCWNPVPGMLNKLEVTREDGIVEQLRRRGVKPTDLQFVVLSHLHHDHAGGLEELAVAAPDVPVYVGPEHWDAFGKHPVWAAMQGCTPDRWPPGFEPRMLDFEEGRAVGPWGRSCVLTANGTVVAVDTPGHVPGHVSLIVVGDNDDGTTTRYLLTGDATYAIDVLEREEPDGANGDPVTAFESLRKIKEYARSHDVVVLPSHDPDTPRLLRDRVVYRPKD